MRHSTDRSDSTVCDRQQLFLLRCLVFSFYRRCYWAGKEWHQQGCKCVTSGQSAQIVSFSLSFNINYVKVGLNIIKILFYSFTRDKIVRTVFSGGKFYPRLTSSFLLQWKNRSDPFFLQVLRNYFWNRLAVLQIYSTIINLQWFDFDLITNKRE